MLKPEAFHSFISVVPLLVTRLKLGKYRQRKKTLFLGLSGSQGSGKTTIANILKIILKKFFKKNICIISIDNFYKTLRDRNRMSKQKHPLFKTRGVPGTHDINLIKNLFISIKKKKKRQLQNQVIFLSMILNQLKKYFLKQKKKDGLVHKIWQQKFLIDQFINQFNGCTCQNEIIKPIFINT